MGRMNRLKAKANRHFKQGERLRAQGLDTKPIEAYRTDHHRADDGWRERKSYAINDKKWKGAKGKTKQVLGPKQPM